MVVVLNCTLMIAQTEFEAQKYVQTDINGTARYMGMGGAFGALGGDASAIKDNPAGLGIFRKSELSGTMNLTMQNTTSKWNDVKSIYENPYKTGLNNFSLIFAMPISVVDGSGLVSSNWSFGYNRLKDFNRNMNIKSGASASSITDYMGYFTGGIPSNDLSETNNYNPYDNEFVPWISIAAYNGYLIDPLANNQWRTALGDNQLVTPSYYLTEKGHLDEYSLGWAGNFSNSFYFGATVNFQSLNYTHIGNYSEDFGSGEYMNIGDTVYSKGNGMNLSIGCIFRPIDYLRLGLSIQTPSIYTITDNYYSTMKSNLRDTLRTLVSPLPPPNEFKLQGPLKINASAALILGKKGIVSVEYDFSNNSGMQLMDVDNNNAKFTKENERMKTNLNNVQTIKIGGEYKLTNSFALRAGFANTSNANNPDAYKQMYENTVRMDPQFFIHNSTNYLTAGFGYREASWFVDFAYVNKILDETFYPYDSSSLTGASVITKTNNVVVTLGLKF